MDIQAIHAFFDENRVSQELFQNLDINQLASSIWECNSSYLTEVQQKIRSRFNASNIKEFLAKDMEVVNDLIGRLRTM